ncbi:RES domain-containing protein [Nitrosovibrio sp. Nv17]|uniref:RES domain-containing protein n=1 Tax=Nitrosovibrio sp. Nv17 TaxID=1855339 RepID=UPI0009091D5A|nr:RES domain-containing protein [Nitrosovibrio sp. Nv17]
MAIALTSQRIDAGDLLQHVSRVAYRGTPLFYGRNGSNRYDAPARDYGVLYLGRDLPTALMESVFHSTNGTRTPVDPLRRPRSKVAWSVPSAWCSRCAWPTSRLPG